MYLLSFPRFWTLSIERFLFLFSSILNGVTLKTSNINDLPMSSEKSTLRIFADDTNMFYSSKDPEQLQSVINEELGKVLKFCAANMLSINFEKTNYMIITSPKKKTNIRITA